MANLSVRKLDDDIYERLKQRAARNGNSMEEEVRTILRNSVAAPERLGDFANRYFGDVGVELELPVRAPHEPIDLGK